MFHRKFLPFFIYLEKCCKRKWQLSIMCFCFPCKRVLHLKHFTLVWLWFFLVYLREWKKKIEIKKRKESLPHLCEFCFSVMRDFRCILSITLPSGVIFQFKNQIGNIWGIPLESSKVPVAAEAQVLPSEACVSDVLSVRKILHLTSESICQSSL